MSSLECAIGYGFFTAMILISISAWIRREKAEFIHTLDAAQRERYELIVSERFRIWLTASIAGLIVGWFAVKAAGSTDKTKNGCIFLSSAFLVQYLWYMVWPKSDWMAHHLRDQRQVKEWHDVYRAYSRTWHIGLALGAAGFFLIGRGTKNQ